MSVLDASGQGATRLELNTLDGVSTLDGLLDAYPGRAVVVGMSKDRNAKVTLLLVPPGMSRPALAVKIPTTAAAAAAVEAERRVLVELHGSAARTVLTGVPRVLGTLQWAGPPAMVVSALPGTPMTTHYHRYRHTARPAAVARDFEAVDRWLAAFQSATGGPAAPIDMGRALGQRLRERFADEPGLDEVLERLDEAHASLSQACTPRTAVHGDLWFGNVLVANGVSGVVDWESGAVSGEPLRDVVRFAITYALYLDRHTRSARPVAGHAGLRAGAWGAGIAFAVRGSGWFPELFRGFLDRALRRLGAPGTLWPSAVLAGLAEVAASADHDDFAAAHLRLLARLGPGPARGGGGGVRVPR
jgi:aminoglycoside phosphotransferase